MSLESNIYLKVNPTDIDPKWVQDGRVYVDCPANFVTILGKRVSLFRNFSKGVGADTVLGFKLPPTEKNDWLFDKLLDPRIANNNNVFLEVWVTNNNSLVPVDRLYVRRRNNDGSYEVDLKRGEDHWVEQSKQLKLNEIEYGDWTFSLTNFQTNRNKTTYQDGDEGYLWADVDYGGIDGSTGVEIGYLRPLFFPLDMIRRGLGQLGWNFRSTFLESQRMRQAVTYVNAFELGVNPTIIANRKFRAVSLFGFNNTDGGISGEDRDFARFKIPWTIDTDPSNSFIPTSNEIANNSVSRWRMFGTFEAISYSYTGGNNDGLFTIRVFKKRADGTEQQLAARTFAAGTGSRSTHNLNLVMSEVTLSDGETIFGEIEIGNGVEVFFASGNGVWLENDPIRILYQTGDVEQINNHLNGDYSLFQYMEGVFHLTAKGYIYTDWATRTIYHYPPYSVNWFGELIEGFYLENVAPKSMVEVAQLGTQIIENKRVDGDRFISLAFADSNDELIKAKNYPKNEPPFSLLLDRGTDFRNKTRKEHNPFFEPTIQGEVFFDNDLATFPTPIAQMYDNDENQVSFEIAPRILFTNPYQVIRRTTGEESQWIFNRTRINSCYVYQVSNAINNDGTAIADQLVYGNHPESLYQAFWRRPLNAKIWGYRVSGLYKYTHLEYQDEPFRKLYQVSYNGKEFHARLDTIARHNPNKEYNTELIFEPEILRDDEFFNTYTTPSDNDFNIRVVIAPNCTAAATFTDDFTDTFINEVVEVSHDEGVTWIPYVTGTFIAPINNNTIFRRTVFLTSNTTGETITIVRSKAFYKEQLCNDRINIRIQTVKNNEVVSAVRRDVLSNVIDTDIWEISLNGSAFFPYTEGQQFPLIDGITNNVIFRRTVTFVGGGCPAVQVERQYIYDPQVGEVNCVHDNLRARIGGTRSGVVFEPLGGAVDNVLGAFIYWREQGQNEWTLYNGIFDYNSAVPIEFYVLYIFENCPNVRTEIQIDFDIPAIP